MSDPVASILSQIRSYQGQMGTRAVAAPAASGVPGADGAPAPAGFGDTLREALRGVNRAQQESGALARAFELGDPRADLARVMVAAQQSQLAFRATVEVRNRLVQAYQDVMNMPL